MSCGTIFALATGGGRAGIAVLRLSGPEAGAALARLSRRRLPAPRQATRARLWDDDGVLDDGLVLWFPAPASYTGEDVAELHVHGGRAVAQALLEALAEVPGLRPADPGEFTRRAFENGKMDLTAAEGIADLVDAETSAQRRQALRQLDGALGRLYEGWSRRLMRGLAHLEASLDFSDDSVPDAVVDAARHEMQAVAAEMTAHLADGRRGERLRGGVHMAILGPPDVGKSSLLNLLARRDAAIVAAGAGTTRDVIEVHLDLHGYPLTVADTAGLRTDVDGVEGEGVRRALRRAAAADLKLVVFDALAWPGVDAEAAALVDERTEVVINKVDLATPAPPLSVGGRPALPISVLSGAGIDTLMERLEAAVAERCVGGVEPAATRARHREAVEASRAALERGLEAVAVELVAEDLRLAVRWLGRITGRVDVDDILEVIFADFCIGK